MTGLEIVIGEGELVEVFQEGADIVFDEACGCFDPEIGNMGVILVCFNGMGKINHGAFAFADADDIGVVDAGVGCDGGMDPTPDDGGGDTGVFDGEGEFSCVIVGIGHET